MHIPKQGSPDEPDAEIDEALAAFGLQQGEPDARQSTPGAKCYLWPCNLPTFNLWQCVQTQWRGGGGMGGRTGLDYASVSAYMRDVRRIKPKAFAEMFSAIQAMENAALDEWAKK